MWWHMLAYVPHMCKPHMTYARICVAFDKYTEVLATTGYQMEFIESVQLVCAVPVFMCVLYVQSWSI